MVQLNLLRIALAILLACLLCGQAALTNDAVVKMLKAGLSEEIIIGTINSQPGSFATGANDFIALKDAGVSDRIIGAIVNKMAGGAPAAAPATPEAAMAPMAPAAQASPAALGAAPPITEVGVYYKKNGVWTELPPEVVNFKTGGALKHIGTIGIVKGDVNGRINGLSSRTLVKTPVELLVYAREGVAIEEYQLLKLRAQKDAREFRTVTGGVLHASGGATRDLLPFDSRKVAPRMWEIVLPSIGSGNYGLLPPLNSDSGGTGRIGKIYSFRIVE